MSWITAVHCVVLFAWGSWSLLVVISGQPVRSLAVVHGQRKRFVK